jgi:hypothetical protein
MEHYLVLATKGEALGRLIKGISEGDPVSIVIVVLIVGASIAYAVLMGGHLEKRGKTLSEALGDCTFTGSPDGQMGKRIFVIEGTKHGLDFSLESRKVGKGDYRTTLSVSKPSPISFECLRKYLTKSREAVDAAASVRDSADTVLLEYIGVGGDPDFIKNFISEMAAAFASVDSAA